MFKHLHFLFTVAALLLTFSATALANDYAVIDHSGLKALVDADTHSFLLIDARNPEEYRESHISGAINIPEKKFGSFAGLLPTDKKMSLIFYCNGIKCGKSKKAAKKANDLGYTNILVFAEGMPVWEELGYSFYRSGDYEKRIETTKISSNELKTFADSQPEKIQIVDVRFQLRIKNSKLRMTKPPRRSPFSPHSGQGLGPLT